MFSVDQVKSLSAGFSVGKSFELKRPGIQAALMDRVGVKRKRPDEDEDDVVHAPHAKQVGSNCSGVFGESVEICGNLWKLRKYMEIYGNLWKSMEI